MSRGNRRNPEALKDLDRTRARLGHIARKVYPPRTGHHLVHKSTKSRARNGAKAFWFYRAVRSFWEMRLCGQTMEDAEAVILDLKREARRIWSGDDPISVGDALRREQELDGEEDIAQAELLGRDLETVELEKLERFLVSATAYAPALEQAITRVKQEISRRKIEAENGNRGSA